MAYLQRATAGRRVWNPPVPGRSRLRRGPSGESGPPGLRLYYSEPGRAAADYAKFLAAAPLLRRASPGDGHPVLVLPGFLASDASTTPLRSYLRGLGYHVHGWGLGRNVGPSKLILLGMRDRLDELAHSHRRPATIIGWSLGGIFARELARDRPEAVRQVITLGSPFRLTRHGPTRARWAFERLTHLHVDPGELPPPEHTRETLSVPASAIYSRGDGSSRGSPASRLPGISARTLKCGANTAGSATTQPLCGLSRTGPPRWRRPGGRSGPLPGCAIFTPGPWPAPLRTE